MPEPEPLSLAERDSAIATIVSAFADDPVERWLWPDAGLYAAVFPGFAALFGGDAFERGTAWGLDGTAAVSVWLGPGGAPDEEGLASILAETVAAEKHDDLFATLGQMGDAHPGEPHWYLPWLAVEPQAQGRGAGSRLLAHGLEIVDGDGLPAFLETPNPRNVPLYERHGFEVVAVAGEGACPPLTSMLRAARR
jgi:GNAT superfamily N-acetyltransferase